MFFSSVHLNDTKNPVSIGLSLQVGQTLSSLMYRNQRSHEHFGEMCLVFEKFICGFQTRNCRLRQVAEKKKGSSPQRG